MPIHAFGVRLSDATLPSGTRFLVGGTGLR